MTTSKEAWDKLRERYEEKGKQRQAYLIGNRSTLSDESALEPQLNTMRHKISSLGLKLEDTLIAIAMVISLPVLLDTLNDPNVHGRLAFA